MNPRSRRRRRAALLPPCESGLLLHLRSGFPGIQPSGLFPFPVQYTNCDSITALPLRCQQS